MPKRKRIPEHCRFGSFIEALCAAHLSSYVEGPFKERSGLMVVGPPSVLKSTLLGVVGKNYQNALELSDINVQSLVDLRDQMASGVIRTLIISELGKIYERHPSTARNLEGHLRALTAEGFSAASFQDSRMNRLVARCTLLTAMVPGLQEEHFKRWESTGFNRRFLWSLVTLADPQMLTKAVEQWTLFDFGVTAMPLIPTNGKIPNLATPAERHELNKWLKWQPGGGMHATQLTLLSRMLSVLVWHYRRTKSKRKAMDTIQEFSLTLQNGGAVLVPDDD